ncbi:MAG: iron-sulfur cluster assembly scaffold protein [Terriglobia bacterium]
MYSAQVLDHFQHPRNAGELEQATAAVEVTNPVCGDVLKLAAQVEGGRVVAVRYKIQGCVTAVACGSLLTEWMQDQPLAALETINYQKISEALGGLPPATAHGARLAQDALHALLAQLAKAR